MKIDQKFPLDGVGRPHHFGAAAFGLVTMLLAGAIILPPPVPAVAAPRPLAASTPTPSPSAATTPSAEASPSPSPATASPSPGASGSPAADDPEAKKIENITSRMEHLNPGVKDWTSDVTIQANVKLSLLVLPMDLHGISYHKAPDKYRFELQNAPALLQQYQQVFGYRPIVLSEFAPVMLADEVVGGRPCYVVRLDKKGTSGDFRSETVWIDKENYTSPSRLYLYKDNGKIDVAFKWRKEKDFTVIDTMEARLEFPKVNGTATVKAQYLDYKFNTGLDDSIFADKKVGTAH
jgi:hypothetical protein